MAEIALTKGYVTVVDDDDYGWLTQWRWSAHTSYTGHVRAWRTERRSGKTLNIYMAREILGLPAGAGRQSPVDHRNGDTLDNRRGNLRVATLSQNNANRRPARQGSSKYLGVCWSKWHRKWHAQIKSAGQIRSLGYFQDELDAAEAYNLAALEAHGEFANLNRIERSQT